MNNRLDRGADAPNLIAAITDAGFDTRSYEQFADGPWLTRPAMQWFWDQYLPDHRKRKDPASPLRASLEQLTDLPRAPIITTDNEVLRDEGEAYGQQADGARLVHCWWYANPVTNSVYAAVCK